MSEEGKRSAGDPGDRIYIIRLDPSQVEKLFESIASEIVPETEEEEVATPSVAKAALKLANELIKEQLATFLGQIIDPRWMRAQFRDRVCQVVEALLEYYRATAKQLIEEIRVGKLRGEDISKKLIALERLALVISLSSREIINRLYTLMIVNAPAEARPPLVNVKLAFEKVTS